MSVSESFVDKPFRPWGVRLFNAGGRLVQKLGRHPRLTSERILSDARSATGLADFGSDDFREPLDILTNDLHEIVHPNAFGRNCLRYSLKRHAENRLLLTSAWQRHPEYQQERLQRPLYIVGMPRTGTTLLYNLLCQDPASRPLMVWEAMHPAVSQREEHARIDPRPGRMRSAVKLVNYLAPHLKQIHPLYPDGPEECGWLMSNAFVSQMFFLLGSVPNYEAWFRALPHPRLLTVYDYYKRQLQLLQLGDPAMASGQRHWILKSPIHQTTLLPLMEAIPTANIVQTHRDPRDVIPSCCSLFNTMRGIFTDELHTKSLGPEIAERMQFAIENSRPALTKYPERILNITYDGLVRDPIRTVRRIYDVFNYTWSAEMEAGMHRWLDENPRGKFGSHRYSLEQFGLTQKEIERTFGDYGSLMSAA